MHCPENNMNLRKKNKPVTAGADEMAYLLLDTYCTVQCTHVTYIRHRNATFTSIGVHFLHDRDRLGFYADIQIFWGGQC